MVTAIPLQQQTQVQQLATAPTPRADLERKQEMARAWKAYRGAFENPLKVKDGQPNDNVLSNRCAPIVDKGVSFLFGQVLKVEATTETTTPDTAVQACVDGIWGDDDDRMTQFVKAATNGGVCGQAFIKIIPMQGGMKYPRVVIMDPMLVRMVTAPDDCSVVNAFIIEYPLEGDFEKRQIIARTDPDGLAAVAGGFDLNDTWTITNYLRRGISGSWYPDTSNPPEDWPYPFPPIFTCQNLPNPNEAWGTPDLTPDLIGQNKVLNFIQSNTSRIIKFHGHPKTWAKGIGKAQMSIGVDEIIVLQSETASLQNLEMHSDLKSSMEFAQVIRDDMDEQSRVPAVALGRLESLPKGNISGVALQMLFQPLIEKTILKQRLYGRLIREVTRACLVLAKKISIEAFEDYPIDLHFANLLPVDDLQAAQAAQILQAIGVSNATVLAELGYNADDEAEKSQGEDAKKLKAYSQGQGLLPPAQPMQQHLPGQPAQQNAVPTANPAGNAQGGGN
jgi:hypothetical protein